MPAAEVVGGVVNLVVDGSRTDLLIVDTGLFLVPGLPRSQNGSAKRRLARFAAADLRREATAPGGRFVPYAEVAGATQTRRTPKAWDLSLRDGSTLSRAHRAGLRRAARRLGRPGRRGRVPGPTR